MAPYAGVELIRARRHRQSYLRFSDDKQLILVRRAYEERDTGEPLILRLPNELLSQIFAIAIAYDQNGFGLRVYKTALSLSIICRRFHPLVQPLLYRHISLGTFVGFVPPKLPAKRFYRTMKSNPSLRLLCERLDIHVDAIRPNPKADDFLLANETLPWLRNVRTLHLHGGFDRADSWPMLLNAICHMPLIEDLSLSRETFVGPSLIRIGSELELPRLRRLSLSGAMGGEENNTTSQFQPLPSFVRTDRKRTATLTDLCLNAIECRPDILQEFLTWPAALERFTLYGLSCSVARTYDWYDFTAMEAILRTQRHSLRNICLGALKRDTCFPRLSDFPNLEEIWLSAYNFPSSPKEAAERLANERLRILSIDCDFEREDSVPIQNFGIEQVRYIQSLAFYASSLKVPLCTICIKFSPCPDYTGNRIYDGAYPWDLMDELREGVKQYGIEISYNSPTVSRENFKCKNEHNYEGHELVAPCMSPIEDDEDKDVEKDEETDAENHDEGDTQEENPFPFRPHGPIQQYFPKV
jgi:F-box-like